MHAYMHIILISLMHACICLRVDLFFLAILVAMPVDVAPVVQAWMECPTIIQRAAVQKLMSFELGPTPEAAESHALVLAPVMKHLGTLDAK